MLKEDKKKFEHMVQKGKRISLTLTPSSINTLSFTALSWWDMQSPVLQNSIYGAFFLSGICFVPSCNYIFKKFIQKKQ